MTIRGLVPLNETLLAALKEQNLILPSRRLQQACADGFDQHQIELGQTTWRAARALTLSDHVQLAYRAGLDRGQPGPSLLLQPQTERLLWMRTAPPDAGDTPDVLVDDVMHAWQLAHDWDLWPHLDHAARTESHTIFQTWAHRFRAALIERGATTIAELPMRMAGWPSNPFDWLPRRVVSYGFEQTPVAIEALWNAYRRAGIDVEHLAHAPRKSNATSAVAYATIELELRAAIAWARDLLVAARVHGDPIRIGIVLPDVTARHAAISRRLDAVLTPGDTNPDPHRSAYNISGGVPLADTEIARTAIDLLTLATTEVHHTVVRRLTRSPSAGVMTELADVLTERLPERFGLATLARMTAAAPLRQLRELVSTWPYRAPIPEWCQLLHGFLEACGWRATDNAAARVQRVVRESIRALSRHAAIEGQWTGAEAVLELRRSLGTALYAPPRPDAPIQVLGYLESAGLDFTHLWVAGLDAVSWPATPHPNPYIPLAVQRLGNVPRCDSDRERAFASATTARWTGSADIVRFSCSLQHAEEARTPSPLIRGWRIAGTPDSVSRWPHPYYAHADESSNGSRRRGSTREPVDDTPAPVAPSDLKTRGSAILRDQFACAFKAFARHRLRIEPVPEPHTFPNPMDRGNVVHRALEVAGRTRIGSTLNGADFGAAIDTALGEWTRFPARVRQVEHARLTRVLDEWLQLESRRTPHRIEAVEAQASLELAGLDFRLRIDRVDRTAAGTVVIDYKTSRVRTADIGLSEPQLALYALALADTVGVFYAQTRSDRISLKGIVATPDVQSDQEGIAVEEPMDRDASSWLALRERWRDSLTRLAMDYLEGKALVRPTSEEECSTCGMQALCRIRARSNPDE